MSIIRRLLRRGYMRILYGPWEIPMGSSGESAKGEIVLKGILSARVFRLDGSVEDRGVIATKKVTTAFVNYLVDAMINSSTYPMDVFKFHDSGTGYVGGESNADTALLIPCGEARDVGTQIEGASANIYKSVATHTYSTSYSIQEHGIFSLATGGTLLDRSVFAVINISASGEKIEWTYQLTAQAET